jgi:hypothetical protein
MQLQVEPGGLGTEFEYPGLEVILTLERETGRKGTGDNGFQNPVKKLRPRDWDHR